MAERLLYIAGKTIGKMHSNGLNILLKRVLWDFANFTGLDGHLFQTQIDCCKDNTKQW